MISILCVTRFFLFIFFIFSEESLGPSNIREWKTRVEKKKIDHRCGAILRETARDVNFSSLQFVLATGERSSKRGQTSLRCLLK